MNIEKEENLYRCDQKLKWFGYGEWVEEPDQIEFNHIGYDCLIQRVCAREPFAKNEHYFGGHLCGYVKIPPNHFLFGKSWDEVDESLDCHGGITSNEYHEEHWVGFDCAHSFDLVPSLQIMREKINEEMKQMIPTIYKESRIFKTEYRNVGYVINQCIHIVEQMIEIQSEKCLKNDQSKNL